MQNSDDNEKSRSDIEQQAIDAIDEGATVIELLSDIEFKSFRHMGDTASEWSALTPFEAMLRALYLKDLMGYDESKLHRRLSENPDEAAALGFDKVRHRSTFNRNLREQFQDDLRDQVQHTTHRILEYAKEQGSPLGMRSFEPEEKTDVSERTEQRLIKEKSVTVANDLRELLYESIDLQRPEEGTVHDDASFLGLEALLCTEACAAEQGSEIYADHAPEGVSVPGADAHLGYLKQLEVPDILEQIDRAIGIQIKAARRHLEFNRPVDIAIDMTPLGIWTRDCEPFNFGPDKKHEPVMGAPPSKEYPRCMKFATASIVGDNTRYMIAARPKIKGQHIGEVVRELYEAASQHVSIKNVYADAEFYAADALQAIDESRSQYIIRVPENHRVKGQIEDATNDVWVEEGVGIYGPTEDGPSNSRVETTHVGVPKTNKPDETVVFATNGDVSDEIGLDRRQTERWINRYRRRWGIETNYRSLKEFLPWTTSKEYSVRLFHFGFAVLVFNMWRLVDFLIQLSLESEYRAKPRLKATRFRRLVKPVLMMYG